MTSVYREENYGGERRFACDAMLGRLARWLRLLGYYTFYSPKIRDDELLEVCIREDLNLLTRDVDFFKRATSYGLKVKLIQKNSFEEQFFEVAGFFGLNLSISPENSRCPECNGLIQSVDKEEIKNKVSANTLDSYNAFWICTNCGQVYWRGRMWRSMTRIVEKTKEKLKRGV